MPDHSLPGGDVVTVFVYRRGKSHASCSCGWDGRRRWLTSHACLDALDHAHQSPSCHPDWPLRCDVPDDPARLRTRDWVWAPILIGGAILTGGLLAAPPAAATPLTFLQSRNDHGILVYDTTAALASGYRICGMLTTLNGVAVTQWVYTHSTWADIPTETAAATWVVVSVEELCPGQDHRGQAA